MRFLIFFILVHSISLPLFAQLLSNSSLEKECDSGSALACTQLLVNIDDSTKQPDLHFKYSKKLCDLKDNDGCWQLAFNYYYLKGDTKQGIKIMTDLCQKKHGTSCKELEEYKSNLIVKANEQNLDIGGTVPCTKEVNTTAAKLCKSNDQYGCFAQAVCLGKEGTGKVRYDNTVKSIKILSKLCNSKYRMRMDVPTACEFKAGYEKDLPGMKAGFKNEEKVAKDETEYQQIISSWNSLNTIEKMSGALKKLDRLCAINHSNSCENKDILKTSIGEFQKIQTTPQSNVNPTVAKTLQEKIIDDQNSKCEKDGHGETCWDLYLANKNNAYYAGRFLKAGCSVGHEKSCMVKKNFDEEQRIIAENQRKSDEQMHNFRVQESEANRQAFQRITCVNKNYYSTWKQCTRECPRYEECMQDKLNDERKKRIIKCTTSGNGGFGLDTTCQEQ